MKNNINNSDIELFFLLVKDVIYNFNFGDNERFFMVVFYFLKV